MDVSKRIWLPDKRQHVHWRCFNTGGDGERHPVKGECYECYACRRKHLKGSSQKDVIEMKKTPEGKDKVESQRRAFARGESRHSRLQGDEQERKVEEEEEDFDVEEDKGYFCPLRAWFEHTDQTGAQQFANKPLKLLWPYAKDTGLAMEKMLGARGVFSEQFPTRRFQRIQTNTSKI